jgi:hypothetical protein
MFIWIKSEVSDFRPVFLLTSLVVVPSQREAVFHKAMPFHQLGKGREAPLGDAPLLGLSWFVMFSGDVEPMVKNWDECYLSEIYVYIYMFFVW